MVIRILDQRQLGRVGAEHARKFMMYQVGYNIVELLNVTPIKLEIAKNET